jgi:hypothetical protein
MPRHLLRVAAAAVALLPAAALARGPVEVEIYDRTSDCVLPVYWHDGERHVAGEPGHEYEIRIRNSAYGRVLAVTSVDGVNVITGRTASPDQSGYVIAGRERVDIDGWRKSLDQVAAFYFTNLADSYAARTGRPDHVGVIGIALFREKAYEPPTHYLDSSEPRAAAPEEEKSADASSGRLHRERRLGTGHGRRLDSGASYTDFERATPEPEDIIRIYYDSERNLVARGVISRSKDRFAHQPPDPFPGDFVPDP